MMNTQTDAPLPAHAIEAWQFRLHRFVIPFVILVMVVGPIYLGYLVTWAKDVDLLFVSFILDNYLVFFVLPYVGLLAYFIVTTLQMSNGPVAFEAGPIKIQGAAGPILFWIITFVAISTTVKFCWKGWS